MLTLLTIKIEAADLHTLLICDTLAENIENSVKHDMLHLHTEMQNVASATGMKYNEIILSETMVTTKEIFKAIKNLKVKTDDTVILYFSGHGYRTKNKTNPWPNIYITNDVCGIDLMTMVQKLTEKKPRLLFAMTDCCNNILNLAPPLKAKAIKPESSKQLGYKKLFLEQSGVIISASATPGEYSWGSTINGGVYSNSLLDNIHSEVAKGKKANWSSIFERVAYDVAEFQHPQYVIQK